MSIFANTGLTPNMLTMFGLVLNFGVAALLASGYLVWGALLLIFAAAFDMADGALAKVTGTASTFGAFLDSVIDRYSDAIMLGGLLIYYLLLPASHITEELLIFAATVGGGMISYARAKAESLQLKGNVGLLARPERILLFAAGLLLSPLWAWALPAALWILAIGTQLTAIQRIWHVYRTVGQVQRLYNKQGKDAKAMDNETHDNQVRHSGLGLHELTEDLQDLGQVTVNLAGDLLQLATAIITLPFQLLPDDTRSHLKNAAREAGQLAQSLVEGTISAVNEGVQQFNRGLRDNLPASDEAASGAGIIEEEPVELGDTSSSDGAGRQNFDPNLEG